MTLLRLTVQTGGPGCHDITDRIAGWLGEIAAADRWLKEHGRALYADFA